jgi:hypothetical protein
MEVGDIKEELTSQEQRPSLRGLAERAKCAALMNSLREMHEASVLEGSWKSAYGLEDVCHLVDSDCRAARLRRHEDPKTFGPLL